MKALIVKHGHLPHLSPPGAGVCDKACATSVELGKSHSESDRCLTLSRPGAALPPSGRAATHGLFVYACLCTVHVCVKDEAGRKPIPDAPAR